MFQLIELEQKGDTVSKQQEYTLSDFGRELVDAMPDRKAVAKVKRKYAALAKKKNCLNCLCLEWGEGDIQDTSGWVCNKKDLFGEEETEMLRKMDSKDYRHKSKVCCVPKFVPGGLTGRKEYYGR